MIQNDTHNYFIQLEGQLDVSELNAASPIAMTAVQVDRETASFRVCADQSGLIGLLRHLHARGLVILSVIRKPQAFFPGGRNANESDLTPGVS